MRGTSVAVPVGLKENVLRMGITTALLGVRKDAMRHMLQSPDFKMPPELYTNWERLIGSLLEHVRRGWGWKQISLPADDVAALLVATKLEHSAKQKLAMVLASIKEQAAKDAVMQRNAAPARSSAPASPGTSLAGSRGGAATADADSASAHMAPHKPEPLDPVHKQELMRVLKAIGDEGSSDQDAMDMVLASVIDADVATKYAVLNCLQLVSKPLKVGVDDHKRYMLAALVGEVVRRLPSDFVIPPEWAVREPPSIQAHIAQLLRDRRVLLDATHAAHAHAQSHGISIKQQLSAVGAATAAINSPRKQSRSETADATATAAFGSPRATRVDVPAAAADPAASHRNEAIGSPRGSHKESAVDSPRGSRKESALDSPRGSRKESAVDSPRGSRKESAVDSQRKHSPREHRPNENAAPEAAAPAAAAPPRSKSVVVGYDLIPPPRPTPAFTSLNSSATNPNNPP